MAYELTEQKKIGLGFIGFGFFFLFLGVILFFDRGLLALGNIFFLAGVALLLGWRSTLQLFTNRANYKGSVCFLLGLFFIFVRWPIVGIIFEIYACVVLFGGFWSSVKVFLFQIPVFGWILQYPVMLHEQHNRGTKWKQHETLISVLMCLCTTMMRWAVPAGRFMLQESKPSAGQSHYFRREVGMYNCLKYDTCCRKKLLDRLRSSG